MVITKVEEVFKDPSMYTKMDSATHEYFKQASAYISKKKNIPIEEAGKLVKKAINNYQGKRNPDVKYYTKDDKGDKIVVEDKLSNYIKDSLESNEIIAPSFTTYVDPSEKKSIHAEFLQENIDKRKVDKSLAFKYKQEGDADKYLYYNTLQKTRKIFNNSLSGAYAAKGTILYNPSGHYTLTSTTRSVTSIGNAITESMIASNKHFKDYNVTINYITSIVTYIDMYKIEKILLKYDLIRPTAEQVMDEILYSTRNYWESDIYENKILEYLKTLNSIELSAVCYVNDMNAVRKYNSNFMKELLTKLSKRVTTGSKDPLNDITNANPAITNLVAHICANDIKGMDVNYKRLEGTDTLMILASTALNATKVLIEYGDFIRTLFSTNITPPTIAYIKDMYRDSIILSDTDSTCGSYDSWVKWYFGKMEFTNKAIALSASVMTINTQIIDHYLQVLTANMNMPVKNRPLIKMKNEFFWDLFTTASVSKHYFANIVIQEGNVFSKPDLELKGVHLIGSSVNQEIRDIARNMIDYIHTTIGSGNKISLNYMATVVADLERKIIKDIKAGKSTVFKIDKIKEESAYKLDRLKSPYIHHMLWTEVFKDKYGNPGEPTYMVINIPTLLKSKRAIKEYLNRIEDKEIAAKLEAFLAKYNKESLGTFRVPLNIVSGKRLMDEIYQAVDIHKVVSNNVNMLYMILESMSFFRKPGMLVSEMGY